MLLHGQLSVTIGPTQATRAKGLWVADREVVKTELGISGSADDTELDGLIAALTGIFAGPQGFARPFQRQTYLERRPGFGGFHLPLSVYPVELVTSVTYGLGDSPETVDASSYSIATPDRDGLYREEGWNTSSLALPVRPQVAGDEGLEYAAIYMGGWVMPPAISDWAATFAYEVGDFVRSSTPAHLALFECTAIAGSGTSGGSEPGWDADVGDPTTDNEVTWTARDAREMPEDLALAAKITIKEWISGGLDLPTGVKREAQDGYSVEYAGGGQTYALPPAAAHILAGYRS